MPHKTIKATKAWIAKNYGEWDVENMSFFKTKREAISQYGGRQEIIQILISPIPQKKKKGKI